MKDVTDKMSTDIRNLIYSTNTGKDDSENDRKKEANMSNIQKMTADKRAAEAAKAKEVGAVVTGEKDATQADVVKTEAGKVEETPAVVDDSEKVLTPDEIEKDLQSLLGAGAGETKSEAGESTVLKKTDNFTGDKLPTTTKVDIKPNATEAEKAEALRKKNTEAAQHNTFVTNWESELKGKIKNSNSTSELQKSFQVACRVHVKLEGFIVEQDATPAMVISKTYLKEKVNEKEVPIARAGAASELAQWLEASTDARKNLKTRGQLQMSSTALKFRYSAPQKVIGAVVTLPSKLNITLEQFKMDEFQLDPQGIKDSGRLKVAVNYDTLFTMVVVHCGGQMKEADYMQSESVNFEKTSPTQMVHGFYKPVTKTKNNVAETVTVKAIKAVGRKQLLVRENIVPIHRFQVESLTGMSAETRNSYEEMFRERLGKKVKEEPQSSYDTLPDAQKALFTVEEGSGEDPNYASVKMNFLTNGILGKDELSGIVLTDWSDVIKNPSGVIKRQASYMVTSLSKKIGKDGTPAAKATKTKMMLGDGFSLASLNTEGYQAAGHLMSLGIKEEDILTIHSEWKATIQEAKQQAALSRPINGGSAVGRKKPVLNDELGAMLLLNDLTEAAKSGSTDINVSKVTDALRLLNFENGTEA